MKKILEMKFKILYKLCTKRNVILRTKAQYILDSKVELCTAYDNTFIINGSFSNNGEYSVWKLMENRFSDIFNLHSIIF